MANKIYNEEIKNKFLNEHFISEDSRVIARYVFYHSYLNELALDKDLSDFTLNEIGAAIVNSRPKSLNVAKSRGSVISQYINWAIRNNIRKSTINPIEGLGDDYYAKFVDQTIKQFISKSELLEIVSGLVNYQDRIIPVLLFNGVYGTESSEIRNLKMSDIKPDGSVKLYDDVKGERSIKLDQDVIDLIKKANHEEEYRNRNGTGEGRSPSSQLVESPYVVKSLKRGAAVEGNRVSQATVIKRIKTIQEFFDLPDLTPKSIWRSGMIYMASQLIGDKEQLGKEDFEKIGDHFNLNKVNNNGYEYYNNSYLSGFINKENIDKLYR